MKRAGVVLGAPHTMRERRRARRAPACALSLTLSRMCGLAPASKSARVVSPVVSLSDACNAVSPSCARAPRRRDASHAIAQHARMHAGAHPVPGIHVCALTNQTHDLRLPDCAVECSVAPLGGDGKASQPWASHRMSARLRLVSAYSVRFVRIARDDAVRNRARGIRGQVTESLNGT